MKEDFFKEGQAYNNVYFMVVDAQGHSKIVRDNDLDKVDLAFDEFEKIVSESVNLKKTKYRCQFAEFWGWQGDGGLCIFYDGDESRARETAISSAQEILAEIPYLNAKLGRANIIGEIHIRIALHKGNFRYKGVFKRGSIHSQELNLVSHAEKVVPADSLAMSVDIFNICGAMKTGFLKADGAFESKDFYLYSKRSNEEISNEWKGNVGRTGEINIVGLDSNIPPAELGLSAIFSHRAETKEYFELISAAQECIWVCGIGLSGFQDDFTNDFIVKKALEGVEIRFLVVDPEVGVNIKATQYSMPVWADYAIDSGSHNQESLQSLVKRVDLINREIDKSPLVKKKYVALRYYSTFPVAMLRVDSILYFSPYMARRLGMKTFTLKLREGRLYEQVLGNFRTVWEENKYSRTDAKIFQGRLSNDAK
jgi:hypothetical protein